MKNDFQVIEAIVNDYFNGLHYANIEKLKAIFHPDCVLKAPGIRRSLTQWLDLVASREVPADRGDPFSYRLINIEIEGEQAMVKISCPLLASDFIDYLGLLNENNQWRIVSKMYADAPIYEEEYND